MLNIIKILEKELSSSDDNVVKLRNLNKNPVLNSYLANNQYNVLTQALIQIIKDKTQSDNNTDVLKFYLHEVGLIFDLNVSDYVQGVV